MSKGTTAERIIGAMERNGLTWGDVTARVSEDEHLPYDDAGVLVDRLRERHQCPLVVAAAIIRMIADLRLIDHGHMRTPPSPPQDASALRREDSK